MVVASTLTLRGSEQQEQHVDFTPEIGHLLNSPIKCTKIFRESRLVGFTLKVGKEYCHLPVSYLSRPTLCHIQHLDLPSTYLTSAHPIYDNQKITPENNIKAHKVITALAASKGLHLKYGTKNITLLGEFELFHPIVTLDDDGNFAIKVDIYSHEEYQHPYLDFTIPRGVTEKVVLPLFVFLDLAKENTIVATAPERLLTYAVSYQKLLEFRETIAFHLINQVIKTNSKIYRHIGSSTDLYTTAHIIKPIISK